MRLRVFLLLAVVAAVVEVVAVKYWIERAGFDCYPRCDAGQIISGWTALIVPVLVVAVLIVSVVRWLLGRRGGDGRGHTGRA